MTQTKIQFFVKSVYVLKDELSYWFTANGLHISFGRGIQQKNLSERQIEI